MKVGGGEETKGCWEGKTRQREEGKKDEQIERRLRRDAGKEGSEDRLTKKVI